MSTLPRGQLYAQGLELSEKKILFEERKWQLWLLSVAGKNKA